MPGDLSAPTGGYAYARAILPRMAGHGIALNHVALPAGYPHPTAADLDATADAVDAMPLHTVLLIDGLAYGAMPAHLIARFRRPIVALVHHPLGYETGLSPAAAAALIASERVALALAHHVIATSETTAQTLRDAFGVSPEALSVAVPGVDRAPRAIGTGDPVQLLALGAISRRKGYDVLVAALDGLPSRDWLLTIVGDTDRDPATSHALRAQIAASAASRNITLTGALEPGALDAAFYAADVFVMPSRYEGYGMAVTEALVRGLPLVSTTGGALAQTVPDAASLKVPPDDVLALREALRRIVTDRALRLRLSDAAWALAASLPTWDETTARLASVLSIARKECSP